MLKFNDLLPGTQTYLRQIYEEIQGSRRTRRDAGFETGPATMTDGSPWQRNVDPLPSFRAWMAQSGVAA